MNKTISSIFFFAAVLFTTSMLGASLTFSMLRGLSVEVLANILVAAATFAMVWITRQSVLKTDLVIRNDTDARRVSVTMEMVREYRQAPIQVTKTLSITAATACAQLQIAAERINSLREVKRRYNEPTFAKSAAGESYRATVESIGIFANFFTTANSLLNQGLLHERLFMDHFAATFVATYRAMRSVHTVASEPPASVAVAPLATTALNEMEGVCAAWLNNAMPTI